MHICKFQYGFGKKKEKFFYGHACGVRVDGASPRGLWPPDAANYKKGARLAPQVVSKGCVRFRSGSDSACGAEGCGIALSGDEYKVSVTGFTFCVI